MSVTQQKVRAGAPDHAFHTGSHIVFLNLSRLPRVVCGLLTSALPGWNREALEGQGPEPAAVSCTLLCTWSGLSAVALDR